MVLSKSIPHDSDHEKLAVLCDTQWDLWFDGTLSHEYKIFFSFPLAHNLQDLLHKPHTLALQNGANGIANLLAIRDLDTGRTDNAIEDELSGNPARQTNSQRHGGVTVRLAVRLERRSKSLSGAIRPLNDELVLKHDEITLALLILHQALQLSAQGIKEITRTRVDLVRREETDPSQSRDDAGSLSLVGELAHGLNTGDDGTITYMSVEHSSE